MYDFGWLNCISVITLRYSKSDIFFSWCQYSTDEITDQKASSKHPEKGFQGTLLTTTTSSQVA